MYLTNEFEDILASEGMGEDVLDNCECVSWSGMGTEAIHDLCPDYFTIAEHDNMPGGGSGC